MMRDLVFSPEFIRSAKRFAKKNPTTAKHIEQALELLHQDAHDPRLKTHKLGGKLADHWACSAGYDLRIVFSFIKHKKKDAILLENVGTHDQMY